MYTPDYSISTPENVDLHLELAGIGNRILAYLIDMTITGLVLFALVMLDMGVFLLAAYLQVPQETRDNIVMILSMVSIFVSFFLMFGYHIFFEGTWQGQTPGKRVAGIRVIFSNGQPVNWGSVFIRNIIRVFDNGMMLIGLLCMLINKDEKRLGDMAAGTLVIRERKSDLKQEDLEILTKAKSEPLIDIGRITNDDYDLLIRYLRRRKGLAESHRPLVAKKLEDYFRKKLIGQNDAESSELVKESPEEFLETLYLTYQARSEDYIA